VKNSLTDALLKTKILLPQIDKKGLIDWVNNELRGYPSGAELPAYRTLPSMVLGNLASRSFIANAHPLPTKHLPDDARKDLEQMPMHQPLAVLRELAESPDGVVRHLPMELNGHFAEGLMPGVVVNSAWCLTSSQDVGGILTQVRSRLLDFLLELKTR
jgi:hypothetical protein